MTLGVTRKQLTHWRGLLDAERADGEIPLPAVDTIVMQDDGEPAILLIAPGILPGLDQVFVNVESMPEVEQVALEGLLERLAARSHLRGPLLRVEHLGGLDYAIHGVAPHDSVRLSELPEEDQALAWRALDFIAKLSQRFPDVQASTPRVA